MTVVNLLAQLEAMVGKHKILKMQMIKQQFQYY